MTVDSNLNAETNNGDRVRRSTSAEVNRNIDRAIATSVQQYANQPEANITQKIAELDREWDTERVLEANASILAFTGLMLGIFVNHNWFWLTGIVLPFLFQHATQGWCPPIPIIRRLGVRTRSEIDKEKFALKVLRGDFANLPNASEADAATRANAALKVVGVQN